MLTTIIGKIKVKKLKTQYTMNAEGRWIGGIEEVAVNDEGAAEFPAI